MHKKKKSYRPKICWDTSVFIALFAEEEAHDLALIDVVAQKIDDNLADLMISVTTFSELLELPMRNHVKESVRMWSKRSNVTVINVDVDVAEKAGEIRTKGHLEGRRLTTPDMQIVATAIIYEADVLHTLDDKILNLHGKPYVYGLKITKPGPVTEGKSLFE